MVEARYTTREVAIRLGTTQTAALHFLTTARVEHIRCGPAYLWNAIAVERLLESLKAAPAAGGETQKETPQAVPA